MVGGYVDFEGLLGSPGLHHILVEVSKINKYFHFSRHIEVPFETDLLLASAARLGHLPKREHRMEELHRRRGARQAGHQIEEAGKL